MEKKGTDMIRNLWTGLFMVLLSNIAVATESEIYIDQSGEALTLTITQQNGALNKINTSINPAIIYGDNNDITIMQNGATNVLNFELRGNANVVDLKQEGNSNTMDFKCNEGGAFNCSDANLKFYDIGDNNTTSIVVKQNQVTVDATITGDTNTTNLIMNSQGGSLTLTVTGNTNTTSFTQSGAPLVPHSAVVSHTGNNGSLTLSQSGSITKTMNVTTNGNNLTATISQSD